MSSHKPRGYSVNDFLSWNDRNELVLQPRFQRRDVWSTKAKSHLIDTILRGLPIPIIFIRQNVDPQQRRTIRDVVDGQQRLRSVISFARNEITVLKSQNPSLGGKTFNDLPTDMQKRFLDYEFSVVLLEEVSDADVLDIFARLNTYAQKLTAQELLNSAYFGEFKQTVYTLGREHLEFWRQNGILQETQIMRMADAELTTELLVVMLVGIQRRRNQIEKLYETKDDSFPERTRVEKEFKSVVDVITNCFGDSLKNTIFGRRVLFYSLFCSFYHVMYGIPSTHEVGPGGKHRQISTSELLRIKDALYGLEKRYKASPSTPTMEKFISACQKATGDRDQRIIRVKKITEVILKAIANKE
jgi:hypothetical protein